jgi:hypothetical protein
MSLERPGSELTGVRRLVAPCPASESRARRQVAASDEALSPKPCPSRPLHASHLRGKLGGSRPTSHETARSSDAARSLRRKPTVERPVVRVRERPLTRNHQQRGSAALHTNARYATAPPRTNQCERTQSVREPLGVSEAEPTGQSRRARDTPCRPRRPDAGRA